MRAARLIGRTIRLRLVEERDAAFILQLRTDRRYGRYLSSGAEDLAAQIDWIRIYKKEERADKQFYFIIERVDKNTPCGTIRIYDLEQNAFKVGSWILSDSKTLSAAVESGFLTYRLGFEDINREVCRIEVRKDNRMALAVHEHLGATLVGEDDRIFYYILRKEQFEELQLRRKIERRIA